MDREKLIKKIMAEAEKDGEPLTREEAEEVADMEIKANSNRHYEKSEETKERKKPTRKVDTEKVFLIKALADGLEKLAGIGCTITKEGEFDFSHNGTEYTVKLVKHRPGK